MYNVVFFFLVLPHPLHGRQVPLIKLTVLAL